MLQQSLKIKENGDYYSHNTVYHMNRGNCNTVRVWHEMSVVSLGIKQSATELDDEGARVFAADVSFSWLDLAEFPEKWRHLLAMLQFPRFYLYESVHARSTYNGISNLENYQFRFASIKLKPVRCLYADVT